jgi:hypothetical protein
MYVPVSSAKNTSGQVHRKSFSEKQILPEYRRDLFALSSPWMEKAAVQLATVGKLV